MSSKLSKKKKTSESILFKNYKITSSGSALVFQRAVVSEGIYPFILKAIRISPFPSYNYRKEKKPIAPFNEDWNSLGIDMVVDKVYMTY